MHAPKASLGTESRRDETIRHSDQDEGGSPLLAAGIAAVVGGDPLAAGVATAISGSTLLGVAAGVAFSPSRSAETEGVTRSEIPDPVSPAEESHEEAPAEPEPEPSDSSSSSDE